MNKINVLIAGASGYIGIQLTKILCRHKNVNIKYLCGSSSIGKKISFYDNDLKNTRLPTIIKFNKHLLKNVDVIFTALPNGGAQKISKLLTSKNILIDLAGDFRLYNPNDYKKWYKINHSAKNLIKKSIYALPEIKKNLIKNYYKKF